MSQAVLNFLHAAKEVVTGAWRTMDNDHAYIHQKKKFSAFHKPTILAGGTLVYSFKTPETGVIHFRPIKAYPSADKLDKIGRAHV